MAEKKLTAKQKRFVAEYLVDANATKAAERAGYSARTAHQAGYELRQNPLVAQAIDEAESRHLGKLEARGEQVLTELGRLAFSDLIGAFVTDKESPQYGTLKPLVEMPEDIRRAIKGFEVEELFEGTGQDKFKVGRTVKVTLWPKDKGLELLGKHEKLFTDKVEVSADESLADLLIEAMKGTRGGE